MGSFDADCDEVLPCTVFDRDPREVAVDLLGTYLASETAEGQAVGRIVETEAYLGSDDPGSHAATKGITKRNATMYGPPGTVYVYFTYGNHHMVNIVCGPAGYAGAVLIRALEPVAGVELMTARRGGRERRALCSGPGKLAQALGVDLSDNGVLLGKGRLSVYDGRRPRAGEIAASGRIGLSAGHDLHLRYYIDGDPYVSRARAEPTRPRARQESGDSKGELE